jgi:glycerol-3-phosphate dehydrogenase
MAEDCVDQAATLAQLDERPCVTKTLQIHGYHEDAEPFGDLSPYGSEAPGIWEMMEADRSLAYRLHEDVPVCGAQVVWAVRHEMARTVDDVLARRTRALPLNARAAIEIAPEVARLMAAELGRDAAWEAEQVRAFGAIAKNYVVKLQSQLA